MFSALKYRNFRLYFEGQLISVIGTWIQQIAMGWLAYRLTGSVLILATVTFMEQIPMLLVTPYISVLIDRYNRHTLLIITQVASMIHALTMALLVLTDVVQIWHIMVLGIILGLINALDMPTRQAFYTSIVPRESLPNAIALNASVINGCRLIGPAIGGFIIALVGEGWCFLINGLSYMAVIVALLMMKVNYIKPNDDKKNILKGLKEGYVYVRNDNQLLSLILLMSAISFFAMPFNSFLPAFVTTILNKDSQTLGILLSCIGIGSFMAAALLAVRRSLIGIGQTLVYAALLMGTCLLLLSVTDIWYFAALLCIPFGFCIITILATINTLLQTLTLESMRGRVMGYLSMSFYGITPLGTIFFGYLEEIVGLTVILFAEGVLCLLTALVFITFRKKVRLEEKCGSEYF